MSVLIQNHFCLLLTPLIEIPDGQFKVFTVSPTDRQVFPSINFVDHSLILDGKILKMISIGKISLTSLNFLNKLIINLNHFQDKLLMILHSLIQFLSNIFQFNSRARMMCLSTMLTSITKKR